MELACGLDVHKDSIFVCIHNGNEVVYSGKFGVTTPELTKLAETLTLYSNPPTCMESTSVYWIPVWNILEEAGIPLSLVNPYFIKQLPGRKSDVKDAEWIAVCVLKDLITPSYVPCKKIQQLRMYDRRIHDLNKELTLKRTKLDSVLQRCNIRISNYVSSTDGKGYTGVVAKLASGDSDPESLVKCIHPRTINKHGRDVVLAALTGCVTDVDSDIISQLKGEIDLAMSHKSECQKKMERICAESFPEQYKNIQTIPGVKPRTATAIIAEVGSDVDSFKDAAHLCSWAGLAPRNDESAGKLKSRRITKGNKYLRQTLIECAWAASRTRGTFLNKFSHTQTVVRRKNVMKVRVAIARKLLTSIWYILHDGVPYSAPAANKSDINPEA